ncbi:MAG: DMT family transporter [Gammaproteobacteria bacterium]|nr:DMT family transporter [Gammaproteobacteria bacterium]
MDITDWVMLATLSVLWGGSFFFIGVAVKDLPPLSIVLLRVGLAAIVLWIVLAVWKISFPLTKPVMTACLTMGFLNNVVPFTLIVWGQTHISSSLASILNASTPLFSLLLASRYLHDEPMQLHKLIGVVIGFFGVAIMLLPRMASGIDTTVLGMLAIVGAAFSYGIASVFGRRFAKLQVSPIATATGQLSASSLLLLPLVLVVDQPWNIHWPSTATVASIVALATFSTALAYILFFRILKSAGAVNIALVTLLLPVTAILLGSVFLGDTLNRLQILGMAFIAVGLLVVDGRLLPLRSNPHH